MVKDSRVFLSRVIVIETEMTTGFRIIVNSE
jgi:hypothetical protein